MFPVKDDIPTDRPPLVTYALLLANVVVFLAVGGDAVARHGLVPADPTVRDALSSMFLHTGLLHLVGNLLFLWWFGPNVEDALGRGRFLAFYVVGGLVAAGAQVAIDPSSTAPLVGASGAIAAVMGAYLRLYPWARVLTLVCCLFFFTVIAIPVTVLLAGWIALQVGFALLDPGSVAYAAHLAGFAFGLLTAGFVATHVKTPESLLRRGRAAWQ
ncbi:rhomboid family intramembrane serine protease [Capillimicrobium parvum]|uniref:Rhomboid protease GlpG n=1 Tax=Capillimicrobium parvum TaxID=2884022 RepID=A0A9E6XSI7_9ACTN|nr:rhomboid family intramembrane serine protease [Capillimicrobium parvum]UGS33926.1 Rhomboid protease GlpG [Capillimicrobium parvum]